MAAMSAADGVVLAMPMSPVMRQRAPEAMARAATSAPTSRASSVSVRDMAGPTDRSAVPRATLRCSTPGSGGESLRSNGDATPTSTTTTSAPTWRASTLTAAPPARKLATIWAVTSWGHGETPAACTP